MPDESFTDLFQLPLDEEPPERPEWTSPPWFAPPQDELGVCVPFSAVVGRSDRAVVALSHALAYSTGISLQLVAHARGLRERDTHLIFREQHLSPGEDELPEAFLRIGIELPGGAKVSNLGGRRHYPDPEKQPPGPVLMQHGGGGGTGGQGTVLMQPGFWLWPLPEPGVLRVSCEWPLVELPLSTVELDGDALVSAASTVEKLWS